MAIDMQKMKEQLINYFKDVVNLDYSFEDTEDDHIDFVSPMTNKSLGEDNGILLNVNIFPNGETMIDFYFDVQLPLYEAESYLNEFNKYALFFKAYLNDDNYLVISHMSMVEIDIEQIILLVDKCLADLIDESNLALIEPLLTLKKKENNFSN